MDPKLPDYYLRELKYQTALTGEFAARHAKIARRFGMLETGETADPYAQRLIQASAWMNARTRMRTDRATDAFTHRQLACVHPNYVAPLPSMAVVRFYPGYRTGQGGEGEVLPRGTRLFSGAELGRSACEFRTAFDLTMRPVEIVHASLGGVPPDMPDLYRQVHGNARVRGSLRLRLRTTNGTAIRELAGFDRLPVYLCGEPRIASHLFELVHTATLASVTGVPGQFPTGELHGVFQNGLRHGHMQRAVEYEGLEPEHSLLPPVHTMYHGHNLVHEYFAMASRFWFFTLTDLAGGLSRIDGPEAEIVLLLDREAGDLAQHVDAAQFALFCTPAINLFPVRTEKLRVDPDAREHRLVPYVSAPDDYEVHSVQRVTGRVDDDGDEAGEDGAIPFSPLDVARPDDERGDERWFTLHCELDQPASNVRRYRTRQPFIRTHTWLTLLAHDQTPDDTGVRHVMLDAWLTNGDLPCTLPHDGVDDLVANGAKSVASVGFVRPPTLPRPPLAWGEATWKLIRQMNLEYGAFDDEYDEPSPGEGLRLMLQPYLGAGEPVMQRQLDGLTGALAMPVHDHHRLGGDLTYMRGIGVTLTFDEAAFEGMSPFTFALVLERYVARHVSSHAFTRTTFCTQQRGPIFTWPTREGTREVL
ncbi:type VI secretion system baseplate subunit TssF [Paraburkholderia sp. B3]|uniref:type VI secretion system baseplate subunit TssF n=1 Tax=Paraburkholderia sp. B3 TaxID=3134791 RepID=UPI003981D990